jgi:hypothetical protein
MKRFFLCIAMIVLTILPWSAALCPADTPSDASAPQAAELQAPAQPEKENKAQKPMTDIIDIKPPVAVRFNLDWMWIAVGAVATLLLVLLLWMILKRWRGRKRKPLPGPPPIPADQRALNLLKGLEDVDAVDPKTFYFSLSAVFRSYLDDRFNIDSMEMTSEELVPCIRKLAMDDDLKADCISYLHRTDPIKFANAPADPSGMRGHLELVKAVVMRTPVLPDPLSAKGSGTLSQNPSYRPSISRGGA